MTSISAYTNSFLFPRSCALDASTHAASPTVTSNPTPSSTGKRGNQVNVIDFGLAKNYRDPKTHLHIPYRKETNLTDTTRYTSNNTRLGVQQARRDDHETLAYVLVYLLRKFLPWQGLNSATKKQKDDPTMEKMTTPIDLLCRGFPQMRSTSSSTTAIPFASTTSPTTRI